MRILQSLINGWALGFGLGATLNLLKPNPPSNFVIMMIIIPVICFATFFTYLLWDKTE
jgi:hypothetical protein